MILNILIQIIQICFCSNTPNTANRGINLQFQKYCIGRKNEEIPIYFKGYIKFIFRTKSLKKFKYLKKLLNDKPKYLLFPNFDLEHFGCLINLRSNSVPITEKTFKYFLDKKFISIYALLTEVQGSPKYNLFIEITSIIKRHLREYKGPFMYKLNEYICYKNLTFNFDLIYSTILFLPVALECEDAFLYIKFIFGNKINPKTNLPILKRIRFEITEYLETESTDDSYKAKIHIFFECMRLIYLRHKDVSIYVILFTLNTYNRMFITRFYKYLKNKNDEDLMFEKVLKRKNQNLNDLVEQNCFIFKIENRQVLEDFFDKEIRGVKYIADLRTLDDNGFI